MTKSRVHSRSAVPAVLSALTISLLAGCAMVSTSPARSVSVYGVTNPMPVVYSLASNNNVVATTVDRTKEGVVLSSTLNEYELPTSWAKVTGTSLYNLTGLTLPGTNFVQGGDLAYYAKFIQLGVSPNQVVLQATANSTSVTYSTISGSTAVTLPSAALSSANQSWYYTQMAAGNYLVLQGSTKDVALTGLSDYTVGVAGSTKANRWLKSIDDATWKTGRDAALAFVQGKELVGASSLTVAANTSSPATWTLGVDDTQVPATWSFDVYFKALLGAFNTTAATTVDATTAATGG